MFLKSLSIANVIFALKYVENIKIKFDKIIQDTKKVKSIEKLLIFSNIGKTSFIFRKKLLSVGCSKKVDVKGMIELIPINWKAKPIIKVKTNIQRYILYFVLRIKFNLKNILSFTNFLN